MPTPEEAADGRAGNRATITAEQLIAAFTLDAPVPIRRLFGLYGARSTFCQWQALGLDVKKIPGMGSTIIPSKFKNFLLQIRGDAGPLHPPPTAEQVELARRKVRSLE